MLGNDSSMQSFAEPIQIGMENGARRALIPLENGRSLLHEDYKRTVESIGVLIQISMIHFMPRRLESVI